MAGRTHLQQALPDPFVWKCATWALPFHWAPWAIAECAKRGELVNRGGAGTLASWATRGSRHGGFVELGHAPIAPGICRRGLPRQSPIWV